MSTSFHRPRRIVCNVAVAIFATALWTSQLNAQESAMPPYDANCNPSVSTESQNTQAEWCRTHIGCGMVAQVFDKTCKGVNFLRNIGKTAPSGQLRNEDVIEAATDDIPYTSTGQRIINNARNAATKAYQAVGELIRTDDGQVVYAETSPTSGGLKSGTVISSNGTMARGQFDAGYRLHGSGQLITPDGKMRAGTFSNNRLNGEGFVTDQDGNRIVLREGTFDGDTPVGEIVVSYADGSKVREIWENGRMVERGRRVPKGQIPPPVRRPQVELASASAAGRKEGLNLVAQPDGQRRYELWCKGRMVDAGPWSSLKSLLPQTPGRLVCEETKLAEVEDEEEIERKDAIERTLEPSRFKSAAGTGGQGSFPCPLGGTANLYEQLRPCLNKNLNLYSDRSSVVSRCQAQFVQAGVSLGEAFSNSTQRGWFAVGSGYLDLNYPWGQIPPDKLARMSNDDVAYVNRMLPESILNTPAYRIGGERSRLDIYARLQACVGRFALCRAGKSAYCS